MTHVFRPLALAVVFSFVAGCDVGESAADCAVGFTSTGTVSGTVAGRDVEFECVRVGSPQRGGATISGAPTLSDGPSTETLLIRVDAERPGTYRDDPRAPEGERGGLEYIGPEQDVTLSESGTITVTEFSDRRIRGTFDLLSAEDEPITGRFEIDR